MDKPTATTGSSVLPVGINVAQERRIIAQHEVTVKEYTKEREVLKAIKQQIVTSVIPKYLQPIFDKAMGLRNYSIQDIFVHLFRGTTSEGGTNCTHSTTSEGGTSSTFTSTANHISSTIPPIKRKLDSRRVSNSAC